ncbi:hypothetical protein SGPA1_21069 [Streptomyces misionensis JCM 4497]
MGVPGERTCGLPAAEGHGGRPRERDAGRAPPLRRGAAARAGARGRRGGPVPFGPRGPPGAAGRRRGGRHAPGGHRGHRPFRGQHTARRRHRGPGPGDRVPSRVRRGRAAPTGRRCGLMGPAVRRPRHAPPGPVRQGGGAAECGSAHDLRGHKTDTEVQGSDHPPGPTRPEQEKHRSGTTCELSGRQA